MNTQSVRVLIVDDNISLLKVLSKSFQENYSYLVDTASDIEKAWKTVAQAEEAYDVILIDNVLPAIAGDEPQASGIDLMRRVKIHSPQTEVIIFTALGMEDAFKAIREGAYRYLPKPFSFDELAAIVSQAVEYNKLKSAEREKHILNRLLDMSTELLGYQPQEKVLDRIIRGVEAIGFDRVRLYLPSEDGKSMVGIAQAGMDDGFIGSERFIKDDPNLQAIINDSSIHKFKNRSDDFSSVESQKERYMVDGGICTPIRYRGRLVGLLSADKEISNNRITEEELGAISLLASQAAIALINAEFLSRDEQKLKRLGKLSLSINEIMSNLTTRSFDDLLDLVARHTAEILEAKVCGVYLEKSGVLRIEASYGHEEGSFRKGREFAICSGPNTGITGHVAYTGELFNKHGHELTSHFAVRKSGIKGLPPKECYSVLAIPLKKMERVIGVLRVEDKKGKNGCPNPNLGFTTEDEWILSIFADAVFVTIETAELLMQLTVERDYKDNLVESSPNGIIAIDLESNVLAFNKRAGDIFGYDQDEVIKKIPVEKLYEDEREPRKIGKMLHKNKEQFREARVTGHETFVLSKNGESIPIRLSATWLCDAQKNRVGSVGYFEDLRSVKEIEQRLNMFVDVSTIMVQATPLSDRLQEITRRIMSVLPHTFYRILVKDESTDFLKVAASCLNAHLPGMANWNLNLNSPIATSEWPGLKNVLDGDAPKIIKDEKFRNTLEGLSRLMGFEQSLQMMLVVPLKSENVLLGLLEIGEIRSENQVRLAEWEVRFVSAVASQISVAIKADKQFEQIKRAKIAAESIAKITILGDIDVTLNSIVTETPSVVGCDVVVLYEYDSNKKDLKYRPKHFGVHDPDSVWPKQRGISRDSLVKKILNSDEEFIVVEDTAKTPPFNTSSFAKAESIKSCVALPLKVAGRKVGVMFVNYKSSHLFTEDELDNIKLFANQAAEAISNSQHYTEATKRATGLEALYKAGKAIISSLDLDATLNAISRETLEVIKVLKGDKEERGSFIHLSQFQNNILSFIAASSDDIYESLKKKTINVHDGQETLWIAGRAAKTGESQNVGDVHKDDDYDEVRDYVNSQLSVPLKIVEQGKGERVIGVLSIEHPDLNAFGDDDVQIINLLAAQAAVAIRNAQLKYLTEAVAKVAVIGNFEVTFPAIASTSKEIIGSDAVVLYEYDSTTKTLKLPPASAGLGNPDALNKKREVREESLIYSLLKEVQPVFLKESVLNESNFARSEGIKTCAVFPLKAAEKTVGLMFVNYTSLHIFTEKEKTDIQIFADLAAMAISNSQLYKQAKKQSAALMGLYKAGQAITESLDLQVTVNKIADQALEIMGGSEYGKGLFSHVALLVDNVLEFVAASPKEIFVSIKRPEKNAKYKDIADRAARTRKLQNVGDVHKDDDYDEVRDYVNSQLSVPLKIVEQGKGERVIGVLSIEHPDLNAFGDDDVQIINLLAAQAVVAINNSRQYEELKKARGLARMGMPLSTWRHSIISNVHGLSGQIEMLQQELTRSSEYFRLSPHLEKIKRATNKLIENPATRPGAMEEVHPVDINKFIQDRIEQFWRYDPAFEEIIKWDLSKSTIVIQANENWLGEALDILIDNALNATMGLSNRKIIIRSSLVETALESKEAEISVIDNGEGILEETRKILFQERIRKNRGERGSGTGLLIAQLILQTYGGNIRCDSTSPSGTTMVISLPLES